MKKQFKKLSLNKITLSNLESSFVVGGVFKDTDSCPTTKVNCPETTPTKNDRPFTDKPVSKTPLPTLGEIPDLKTTPSPSPDTKIIC